MSGWTLGRFGFVAGFFWVAVNALFLLVLFTVMLVMLVLSLVLFPFPQEGDVFLAVSLPFLLELFKKEEEAEGEVVSALDARNAEMN